MRNEIKVGPHSITSLKLGVTRNLPTFVKLYLLFPLLLSMYYFATKVGKPGLTVFEFLKQPLSLGVLGGGFILLTLGLLYRSLRDAYLWSVFGEDNFTIFWIKKNKSTKTISYCWITHISISSTNFGIFYLRNGIGIAGFPSSFSFTRDNRTEIEELKKIFIEKCPSIEFRNENN